MKYAKCDILPEYKARARIWCLEQFGPCHPNASRIRWNEMRWFVRDFVSGRAPTKSRLWVENVLVDRTRFYFSDPAHATLFALRWS